MIHADIVHDHVYLCREPVDMRKSINGLSIMVEEVLTLNPFSGHWFVFCNRRRDKVKLLYWSRNGFCLWYKRLEKQRFKWPRHLDGEPITLTPDELRWLLDGYDLAKLKPHQKLLYESVL
jgi:transposase